MKLTWRPIERWDGPVTEDRRPALFKATHSDTKAKLGYELGRLNADAAVVQVDVEERHCRVTGQLHERAVFHSPRIRLAFESMHGPLTYQCDAFTKWQSNLRAITLGLEALRRLERYGIAGRGEQYTGWAALGSGIVTGQPLTRAEAVTVVLDLTSVEIAGEMKPTYAPFDLDDRGTPGAFLEDALRAGARLHHPDRGGNAAAFTALTEAIDVLRQVG